MAPAHVCRENAKSSWERERESERERERERECERVRERERERERISGSVLYITLLKWGDVIKRRVSKTISWVRCDPKISAHDGIILIDSNVLHTFI